MSKTKAVRLSGIACVGATVYVDGAKDDDQARKEAMETAKKGDVSWRYEGVEDSTIEVTSVSEC